MDNQLKFKFSKLYAEIEQSIKNDDTLIDDIAIECLDDDENEYLSLNELSQILETNKSAIKEFIIKYNKCSKNNKIIIDQLCKQIDELKNLKLMSFWEKPAVGQQIVYIGYHKPSQFMISQPVTVVRTGTTTYDVKCKKKKSEQILTINRDYLIFDILRPESIQIALFEERLK